MRREEELEEKGRERRREGGREGGKVVHYLKGFMRKETSNKFNVCVDLAGRSEG